MNEVSFGEWLKRRRKALGLTQEQFAQQISCSTSALRKIEAEERRPSEQMVGQLADVFNIPSNGRGSFLKFARGHWDAVPVGSIEENSPWSARHPREYKRESKIPSLPSGTVTFLFTDIEGSTQLAQQYSEAMPAILARHHEILHQAIQAHNGYAFQVVGDEFATAFHSARDALGAALSGQHALQREAWSPAPTKVRMGIHTGAAQLQDASNVSPYIGYATIALTQRIMSAAHGGQILLSHATENLLRGDLPKDVGLRDLGEHKFRDIQQPVRVFQVIAPELQKEFPALSALDVLPNNLPHALTSFIGREKELDEITSLIARHRLVTLTGAGGIGKTRLSIQVGFASLNEFPNGTWLVELAPLSDPTLVPQVIINTLGLIEQSGRSTLDILTDYLQSKRALLILDNCEHLIQACAQLAERLLQSCPGLQVLATSREALNIAGETLYHVPSLNSPGPLSKPFDRLPQYEAVQLFVERAQSTVHHFSLTRDNAHAITQICHHLEGIPLALELAAARVKLLSVEEIAGRLDERFHLLTSGARTALPRHQTLQALVDWSYDLLSEPERVLLRRLSVFAGGWTLEVAGSVCGGKGLEAHALLDLLAQLTNKSLVLAAQKQGQETRYHMLETIRQYAQEKLWAADEGEWMRQRHLAYYVDLAEQAEPNLRAFDMVRWLDRLESELDDIRTAMEYALESDIEAELRLASALLWFWHIRGHKNEGIDWLERGLSIEAAERGDQPLTPDRAMIRGKALNGSGILLSILANTEKARTRSEEALALLQELGSRGKPGRAYALLYLADAAVNQEGPRQAKTLLEKSLALFQEVGDKFGMAQCLGTLSWVASLEGDYDHMQKLLEDNLALRREIGDKDGIAYVLTHLARLTFFQGDLSQSVRIYEESLAVFDEVGNEWARGRALVDLARVAQAQGDYGKATNILEEALALGRDLGDKFRVSRWLDGLGGVAQSQGDYERAARLYEEGLLLAREMDDPETIARNLSRLGNVALAHGDYSEAASQFEAALSIGQERQMNWTRAIALSGLGRVAWAQGHFELARKRLEAALAINREAGIKTGMGSALYCLGRVFQSQGDYASAHVRYVQALAIARELGYRVSILEALATLSVAQSQRKSSPLHFGNLRHATRLFAAAESRYPPLRFEMSAAERAGHDQAIAAARTVLGEEAFTGAWEEGEAMTLEQALALAIENEVVE